MSQTSIPPLPQTGLAGLKENWRDDLLSGFLVFLIALPLCLGVAVASGFPPSAGIISAIIGGVVVSRISGSYITINGPAAGLIVVVLSAVENLGQGDAMAGYRYTLAAIVVASLLQILLGFLKAGSLSSFFPSSVVHGMLAAIGIIIIIKQTHVMLGVTPEAESLLSSMAQIPHSLVNLNPEIAVIGFSCLGILMLWTAIKNDSRLKMIPPPLVVVIVGMALVGYYKIEANFLPTEEATLVIKQFLVNISDDFSSSFYFPDFSKTFTFSFWEAVITICLVASLESLLSAKAIDKLDPYKRHSDLDRDLTALGIGNLIAGMIGGLPMIAEIVRSSTNVNSGAKTGWANFFHGALLLLFVVLFPGLIRAIPLAALAAILIYTGYRLAAPQTFKETLQVGKEQLFLFVITIVGVLATNLLIGVVIGVLGKLGLYLVRGVWLNNLFKIHFTITETDNQEVVIKLNGSALTSNFLPLKNALATIELGKTVIFDFSNGYLIDHTVMEFIDSFILAYQAAGGHCKQQGQALQTFSDHKLAARIMTEDARKA